MACFLLVTAPALGHVNPSTRIARELVLRGNEVVWITGSAYQAKVQATGARYHPLPAMLDPGEADIYDFYPHLKTSRGLSQIKHYLKIFLDGAVPLVQAIDCVLGEFAADVLVGDSTAFGLYFRSEMAPPPSARISLLPLSIPSRDTAPFGLGLLPGRGPVATLRNRLLHLITQRVLLRSVTVYANDVRQRLGLAPLNGSLLTCLIEKASLIVHLSTPAFEYPRSDQPKHVQFVGPIIAEPDPGFQPPEWWSELHTARPVVLVNQGTVASDLNDLLIPTIQALAGQQMLLVAVPVRSNQLGNLPAHVRSAPFIPFANLLPHVDVMVTNGGFGGTQLALAHGIPLVVAGATDDKMEVAARVEWSGSGINLRTHRPCPETILAALKEVFGNPRYRNNAERIQTDFSNYDAPRRTAELLEDLVQDFRLNG